MQLTYHKVATLPGTLENNAIYYVKGGGDTYADIVITDSSGNGVQAISDARILAVTGGAGTPELEIVADITARDALSLSQNTLVLVQDATGDATVDSGAAMYMWNQTGSTFIKVTEFESLDVVVNWGDVVGRPTSTPAQIDQAVTDSHTHANKATLDLITSEGSGAIITTAERNQIGTNTTSISNNASNISTNSSNITSLQADSHTHTNKTQLDQITEDGSQQLLYRGNFPTYWTTVGWSIAMVLFSTII